MRSQIACHIMITAPALLRLAFVMSIGMGTTTAFVPHHAAPKWGKVKLHESSPNENKSPVLDDNFDDVNLARVLGLRRVKKMLRKYKRQRGSITPNDASVVAVAAVPATQKTIETVSMDKKSPLKMIISGAPASGKGTQ